MKKQYFEIDFVAKFVQGGHRPDFAGHPEAGKFAGGGLYLLPLDSLKAGETLAAINDNMFAEVMIPYHTKTDGWMFNIHILNLLNHQLAIEEALALQGLAEEIHQRYRHHPAVKPAVVYPELNI